MKRPIMLEALNSAAFEMQLMDAEIKRKDAEIERLFKLSEDWRKIALAPENQPQAIRNQAIEDAKAMVSTVYKEIDIPSGLSCRQSYEHGWRGASWEIGERLEAIKATKQGI